MKGEILEYKDLGVAGGKKIFTHTHIPGLHNNKLVLFLNPIFDEKKRVQKFQINTARELQSEGFMVLRFDYFGTGDSTGETYQVSHRLNKLVVIELLKDFDEYKSYSEIILVGIRYGASLAVEVASSNPTVTGLVLIDPIISGKKYLSEQKLRRRAFQKLNNMQEVPDVDIGVNRYEDHQGFLVSTEMLEDISTIVLDEMSLSGKEVGLFSVDPLNRKKCNRLQEIWSIENNIHLFSDGTSPFWNSLELVDTKELTKNITNYVLNFHETEEARSSS